MATCEQAQEHDFFWTGTALYAWTGASVAEVRRMYHRYASDNPPPRPRRVRRGVELSESQKRMLSEIERAAGKRKEDAWQDKVRALFADVDMGIFET